MLTTKILGIYSFPPLLQLGSYNAALLAICFILLLGFIDDVLDLRWSVKILLSFVGTLPLLVEYSGPTLIIVPKPLVFILGNSLPLGTPFVKYFGCGQCLLCSRTHLH